MPKNTNDFPLEELPISNQASTTEKRSHLPGVRSNLFSLLWSKLAALCPAAKTSNESEVPETSPAEAESIRERYLHTCFTDSVDPSLYYILFFSPYVDSQTYNELKRFTSNDEKKTEMLTNKAETQQNDAETNDEI